MKTWSNETEAREQIKELVAQYYHDFKEKKTAFQPGDRITYASRVFDEKEMCALTDAMLDFWLTTGRFSDEFEKEFAKWIGVKYAHLVNSGSSANLIAFSVLTAPELGDRQIKRGDEVITVACGFPTTVTPVLQYGAVPVFVDVTVPQYNIDASMLEAALSEKTKAVMVASEITQDNIFTVTDSEFVGKYNAGSSVSSADIPEGVSINPIDIYVERVAAKVRVKGAEGVNLEKLPVYAEDGKTQMKDAFGNVVYAKILGWNITNCTDEAYLLKNVEASWTDASLGFAWNNPAHFRSYWTKTTDAPVHPHSFTALAGRDVVTEDYYFENTHSTEHAQLLVAAQLVNEEGAAIQLAKWYNVLYTIADLKTAMINTVATKLYVKDAAWTDANKVYRSVTTEDVTFYQVPVTTETKRYEVKVAVKEGVQYFYADGTAYEANKPEEILGNIAPAQMWTDGSAYYYTEIKHFGSEGKAGEFGIVRNHVYDVTLSGVKGFGTPVYDPELVIIPERTEKQEALNLAAQINILSWHLVAQDVTLQ